MTEREISTIGTARRLGNENAIRKEIELSLSDGEGMPYSSRQELEHELLRVKRIIVELGGEALLDQAA